MTSQMRGRERLRRILLSAGASAISRGIAFGGSLITIPIALHHLGSDRFGLWITIISLLTTLNFADLGIGNGLITAIAQAHARKNASDVVEHLSSATAVLGLLAVVGIVAFLFADARIEWGAILNATTTRGVVEADPAVRVLAMCLLVGIPVSLAQKTHLGLQEAFVAHLWTGFGSILAVTGVVLAVVLGASLTWLVLAAAGGPVFAALLNCIHLFVFRHPEFRPRVTAITKKGVLSVSRRGLTFLLLGICASVAYQADLVVIARVLGADAVSEYAVPLKLFFIAPTLLGFVLIPLWPAYSDALATGDVSWVRNALRRSILTGVAFTASVSAALVFLGPRIIHAWVGDTLTPSTTLLVGMALWAIVNGIGGPVAMFLNGTDQLRFLVVVTTLMAIVNLGSSIYLTLKIGVAGPVYASVVTQLVIVLIPSMFYIRRIWPRFTRLATLVEPIRPTDEISTREYRLIP